MPEQSSLKPRRNARASKVLVTKADGTQEVQNAYNRFQLRAIEYSHKPKKQRRKKARKRVWITKTRNGELVAIGDVEFLCGGMQVLVKDEWTHIRTPRTIIELGKPFMRNRRVLVYGYFRAFHNSHV